MKYVLSDDPELRDGELKMEHELFDAVTALADRLVNLAAQDDELRDSLRGLAEAVPGPPSGMR